MYLPYVSTLNSTSVIILDTLRILTTNTYTYNSHVNIKQHKTMHSFQNRHKTSQFLDITYEYLTQDNIH